MTPRHLMTSSGLFMGALGAVASFLPQEIIAHFGSEPSPLGVMLIQILGAMYLGSAILN